MTKCHHADFITWFEVSNESTQKLCLMKCWKLNQLVATGWQIAHSYILNHDYLFRMRKFFSLSYTHPPIFLTVFTANDKMRTSWNLVTKCCSASSFCYLISFLGIFYLFALPNHKISMERKGKCNFSYTIINCESQALLPH